MNSALPPVESYSTPIACSPLAKASRPDLSDTEISARVIFMSWKRGPEDETAPQARNGKLPHSKFPDTRPQLKPAF